jgi:hypothetical protein
MQRQRSDLLAVASRYGSFPIILTIARCCARLRLPALADLLRASVLAIRREFSPAVRVGASFN